MSTGNIAFPLVTAFMDGLNLMSSYISGAQNLYTDVWNLWTRGKSMKTTLFYVNKTSVPSDFTNYIHFIHSVAVKLLGWIINASLTDGNSIDELQQKLVLGLNIINK